MFLNLKYEQFFSSKASFSQTYQFLQMLVKSFAPFNIEKRNAF